MVSKRIKLISSFLDKDDSVLDIGTDHALLPIYSVKNNLVKKIDGSDISENVIVNARKNLLKYGLSSKINLYLSDGLKDIDINNYNTLVICGMGYHTIKNILNVKDIESINKMIVQTNNHYSDFRIFITSIGYKIDDEIYINDHGKDYIIFIISKGVQKLTKVQKLIGIYNPKNLVYYKKQICKLSELTDKITDISKINYNKELIKYYNEYLINEKIEENY